LALPFTLPHYDAVSGASPLAALKFEHAATALADLFLGTTSGSLGETSSLLILLCGLYLVARKMVNWRIPAGIFLAVIMISSIGYSVDSSRFGSPLFMLFSGGLMLGAMFMATDPVASPVTHRGCLVYGLLIGCVVMVIRNWGGLAEGVMYAILFANAVAPHIDDWLQPRPFGRSAGSSKEPPA
jgi:electron transport complex protein RnfD